MHTWKNSRHEISSFFNITQMQNLGTFLYQMKCRKCKNPSRNNCAKFIAGKCGKLTGMLRGTQQSTLK
jgi:hypothetical protein